MFPELTMWGCVKKPFQYIKSYDSEVLKFFVSAKRYPNSSKMIELGEYYTDSDADAACEAHWSNNRR